MDTALEGPKLRTITPTELRARLRQPEASGNKEKFLRAIVGCMSEGDADKFERRINEMNERVEGDN